MTGFHAKHLLKQPSPHPHFFFFFFAWVVAVVAEGGFLHVPWRAATTQISSGAGWVSMTGLLLGPAAAPVASESWNVSLANCTLSWAVARTYRAPFKNKQCKNEEWVMRSSTDQRNINFFFLSFISCWAGI